MCVLHFVKSPWETHRWIDSRYGDDYLANCCMIIELRCFIAETRMENDVERDTILSNYRNLAVCDRGAHRVRSTHSTLRVIYCSWFRFIHSCSAISFFLWKWMWFSDPHDLEKNTEKDEDEEIDAWKQFRKLLTIIQFAIYFLFLVDNHWFHRSSVVWHLPLLAVVVYVIRCTEGK